MKKVSYLVAFLAALLVAPVLPGTAGAHVEMTPSDVSAGKPANLSFEIPHGCDGAATTSLVVQIPTAAQAVKAKPIKGWKATTAADTLTWTGGPLPDDQTLEIPFRATVYGKKGDTVMFKVIQRCQGGAQTAWIQPTDGGTEPEHPAPAVTLTSSASLPADTPVSSNGQAADDQTASADAAATGEPTATAGDAEDSSDDEEGGGGKRLLLIIVAGLAIGTVAGIVVRGRRRQ